MRPRAGGRADSQGGGHVGGVVLGGARTALDAQPLRLLPRRRGDRACPRRALRRDRRCTVQGRRRAGIRPRALVVRRRTGTWPDLRDVARRAGRDAPMPTADSWCNGAPGIALSRLRAAELLGSTALYCDADLALAACERHVSELLVARSSRLLALSRRAGAGDVLLYAADSRRVSTQASRPRSAVRASSATTDPGRQASRAE